MLRPKAYSLHIKITSLSLYEVKTRWVFLKVDTDEGPSGWGEPVLEGKPNTSIAEWLYRSSPCILPFNLTGRKPMLLFLSIVNLQLDAICAIDGQPKKSSEEV